MIDEFLLLQDPHAEEFEDKEWTFVIENVSTSVFFLTCGSEAMVGSRLVYNILWACLTFVCADSATMWGFYVITCCSMEWTALSKLQLCPIGSVFWQNDKLHFLKYSLVFWSNTHDCKKLLLTWLPARLFSVSINFTIITRKKSFSVVNCCSSCIKHTW